MIVQIMSAKTSLLGVLVLIPVAFGAGYLGALVGAPAQDAGGSAHGQPTSASPIVQDRLDENTRGIQNLERNLLTVQETADEALSRAAANEIRIERLERGGGASATTPDQAAEDEFVKDAVLAPEDAEKWMAKHMVRTHRQFLTYELNLYGDTTPKGTQDRSTQAITDAQRQGGWLRLKDERADKLRDIYLDHMTRAAAEIGPLLADGVESADVSRVRETYASVWAGTDAQVMAMLEGDILDDYERTEVRRREQMDSILRTYEKQGSIRAPK